MSVLELQRKIYPGINFSDTSFRIEDTDKYDLNIFLNESQFLFDIFNPENRKIKHLQSFNFFQLNSEREMTDSVKMIFETEDLFNQNYKSVTLALYHEFSTLVPIDLFDETMLEDYLKFNFTIDFDYEAIYDVIEDLGIVNIFAIEKSLKKVFELKFKNPRFLHSSTSLIHQLNILNKSLSGENIYVYVQPKIIQICFFNNNTLKYFNSFHYSTPEDFIYYLLYVCQQLQLNTETIQLHLMGEIVKDSVLFENAYKYIRFINFAKKIEGINIDTSFKMPEQFYYNLFSISK
jgi:hypothetical protein